MVNSDVTLTRYGVEVQYPDTSFELLSMEGRSEELCFYDGKLEEDGWGMLRSGLIRQKEDRLLDQFIDDVYFPTTASEHLPGFDTGSGGFDDITFVSFAEDDSGFKDIVVKDSNPERSPYGSSVADSRSRKVPLFDPDSDNAAGTKAQLIRVSTDGSSPNDTEKLLLGDIRCPKCGGGGDPVDDLSVRFCRNCDEHFGFDDSMDIDDLERLITDNKVRLTTKCRCGNDDVNRLRVTAIDDVTGQLTVRCQLCSRSMEFEFEMFRSESRRSKEIPACAECGNCENDLFEQRYDVIGRMTSFRCLACNEPEVTHQQQQQATAIVCPVCRNDRQDRFEVYRGSDRRVISAACLNCRNFFGSPEKNHINGGDAFSSISSSSSSGGFSDSIPAKIRVQTFQRQIRSLGDVRVGDHVMWQREYGLCHHAIATDVRPRDRKLTVVHYTGSPVKHLGHYVSVREEEVEVDPTRERVFVHDYDPRRSAVGPAEAVARARSRMGEHSYNPLSRNCEHFAYWCKTGLEHSGQAESVCRRLWKTCASVVSVGVREGIVNASRAAVGGLPARRVLGVGLEEGLHRLRDLSGGSGLAAKLVGGAVAVDVLLNLALEAGLFAYCAYRARQKYKAGEITREEYLRRVTQSGCECAGGFLGATGGGLLGQLAIPVPFLGSLIGCTIGTLIGRFVGTIVGKKISDKFIDKR